ncbi:MAG: phosphoribosylformylglycinamidine cyclo-ligase [Caldilineaceae bacterium SB0665_bin_25]|nr:phosphoribosylformylglycinamidine cyclo-ligase [Caldilineaceae bacterium SB0665_bin_25]
MTIPRRIADRSQDTLDPTGQQSSSYADAGVDIDAGKRAVDLMKAAVRSTFTPDVRADIGSFGGLFALNDLPSQPLLVASTDGVGTKVKLAAQHDRWQGIGQDIVNHCLNDILVQGARPLFFLDYIAADKLVPENVAAVVLGMSDACRAAGCALLGGETAEMPGVYTPGSFDVAGTIVGLVGQDALLPRPHDMRPGDLLFGLPSSGPHTNGYSLIRRVLEGRDPQQPLEDGVPLIEAALAPHRSYLTPVQALAEAGIAIKGLAHITGGGLADNVPRILPAGLRAQIDRRSWEDPPVFRRLFDWSGMDIDEAYRVFNMGIGMVVVIGAGQASSIKSVLPEAVQIGSLAASAKAEPDIAFEG